VNPPVRGALLGQEGKFGHALITTTSAAPTGLAGVYAVIVEPFSTIILVAFFPPTVTTSPARKLLPATVIGVPPDEDPLEGVTELTLGGPTGWA